MANYQFWDKQSVIYTRVGERLTAEQWAARYPWANLPGAKMIIGTGPINGSVVMELEDAKRNYKMLGAAIEDGMTDEEVLAAIEAFEDAPPEADPSAEERTAAALEFMALNSLPDEVV